MDKIKYLYAFEDLFRAKCKAADIDSARWVQGMWTNAHMSHGNGDTVEIGVDKWFAHVDKYSPARVATKKQSMGL